MKSCLLFALSILFFACKPTPSDSKLLAEEPIVIPTIEEQSATHNGDEAYCQTFRSINEFTYNACLECTVSYHAGSSEFEACMINRIDREFAQQHKALAEERRQEELHKHANPNAAELNGRFWCDFSLTVYSPGGHHLPFDTDRVETYKPVLVHVCGDEAYALQIAKEVGKKRCNEGGTFTEGITHKFNNKIGGFLQDSSYRYWDDRCDGTRKVLYITE